MLPPRKGFDMTAQQALFFEELKKTVVSPYEELIAYEYMYSRKGETLRRLANDTVRCGKLPSELLEERKGLFGLDKDYSDVVAYIESKLGTCAFAINGTYGWPERLNDSAQPAPVLYYRGDINLLKTKSVSVVGARAATADGMSRSYAVASQLIENGITVVTGLAKGIDTAAAEAVISSNGKGRIIGVIGTPIDEHYPKENRAIQDYVAQQNLLLSQVPFYRYKTQHFKSRSRYFPERNELMAAVSDATVIVEASDTSGSLSQARACVQQGRPLFIMKSCAQNPSITWPERFIGKANVYELENVQQVLDVVGG